MPNPLHGGRRAPNKRPDPRRALTVAAILAALPATKTQIVKATGLGRDVIYEVVDKLGAEPRQIRVGRWRKHPKGGPSIPVYAIGAGKDAVDNLPRLTKKQIQDRYMAKSKASGDRYDVMKAKSRAKHWTAKALSKPNTWLSILGAP